MVVYSANWKDRVSRLAEVFRRLAEASLTLNLAKCEFGKASVTYVGKQVGHGQLASTWHKSHSYTDLSCSYYQT